MFYEYDGKNSTSYTRVCTRQEKEKNHKNSEKTTTTTTTTIEKLSSIKYEYMMPFSLMSLATENIYF